MRKSLSERLRRVLPGRRERRDRPPEPGADWLTALDQRQLSNRIAAVNQGLQHLLRERYRQLAFEGRRLPEIAEVEFRCNSQNGEDGIIHYVFSLVGAKSRRAVEICAGEGIECNSANLIINHGWEALLLDGDESNIARGREFYARCQDTFSSPPNLVTSWITKENVNALLAEHRFTGEVDLLSIDLDGMDYWVWKELQVITPRLVVVEFNPVWGPDLAVSVPYDPDFRIDYAKHPYYCSASLSAFTKLARQKGYRLIGVQRLGFNAFFLQDGIGDDMFPGLTASECFQRNPALREWQPHWIPDAADRPEFGAVVQV